MSSWAAFLSWPARRCSVACSSWPRPDMKAESVVFTGMQRPLTMLGLPPALLIGTACAAGMVMLLFVYVGLLPLALPAFILSFAWLWWKLWRRQQADGHFGSEIGRASGGERVCQ